MAGIPQPHRGLHPPRIWRVVVDGLGDQDGIDRHCIGAGQYISPFGNLGTHIGGNSGALGNWRTIMTPRNLQNQERCVRCAQVDKIDNGIVA